MNGASTFLRNQHGRELLIIARALSLASLPGLLLVTVLFVVGKNEHKNPVSDSWNNKVLYDMIDCKTVIINHVLGRVRWLTG